MAKITKAQFQVVLEPVHRTFWKQAYKKMRRKISSLKSSLKKRSDLAGVDCIITTEELDAIFYSSYGTPCKYCEKILNIRTIACDHIVPLKKSGPSIISNLQLICRTCNTRKGPLDEVDFQMVMNWIKEQPEELGVYLLRKLAKGGRY
jgi:5-methylcytosine-specific restriction endonuclease McrA